MKLGRLTNHNGWCVDIIVVFQDKSLDFEKSAKFPKIDLERCYFNAFFIKIVEMNKRFPGDHHKKQFQFLLPLTSKMSILPTLFNKRTPLHTNSHH